ERAAVDRGAGGAVEDGAGQRLGPERVERAHVEGAHARAALGDDHRLAGRGLVGDDDRAVRDAADELVTGRRGGRQGVGAGGHLGGRQLVVGRGDDRGGVVAGEGGATGGGGVGGAVEGGGGQGRGRAGSERGQVEGVCARAALGDDHRLAGRGLVGDVDRAVRHAADELVTGRRGGRQGVGAGGHLGGRQLVVGRGHRGALQAGDEGTAVDRGAGGAVEDGPGQGLGRRRGGRRGH